MFLQLITAVEILPTIGIFTSVLAHLAMSSAMFGEVGRLGESLSTDIAFQWFFFRVSSFVDG
jgi:hypothetical protein